jgi:hypothetical protein
LEHGKIRDICNLLPTNIGFKRDPKTPVSLKLDSHLQKSSNKKRQLIKLLNILWLDIWRAIWRSFSKRINTLR